MVTLPRKKYTIHKWVRVEIGIHTQNKMFTILTSNETVTIPKAVSLKACILYDLD